MWITCWVDNSNQMSRLTLSEKKKKKKKIDCCLLQILLAILALRLLIMTIRTGGAGSADSKACQTYYIPHATIQSKCSHTGVNLLSYKHATFH